MKKVSGIVVLFLCLVHSSCRIARNPGDDGKIEVVFLQVNDVYEIAPLSDGKEGGVARIATLKKQYLAQHPNTFLVMAGDFLSPSIFHSLQYQGSLVRGKQMVESLNAAGLDIATFGNHEFDIREAELQSRLDESLFKWVSSNTHHIKEGRVWPFTQKGVVVPRTYIMNLVDADGTNARIGLISLTLPFNRADYVHYFDPLATAKEMYAVLKDSVDVVIALTHQSIESDIELARAIPDLAIIMGGHEHDNRFVKEGNVYITKAHANAKSAYALHLNIDKRKGKKEVVPVLVYLNEKIALDSATQVVVDKWTSIAENNFSSLGFNARKVILNVYEGETLDGRETEVRRRKTGLTRLIVKGIEDAAPSAAIAIMNSGSIRVDDELRAPLTEYDLLRTLPFGGSIREVDMKGSLLIQVMEQGLKNSGVGGFLHLSESLTKTNNTWQLAGVPIESNKTYRIALTEFLLTGKEANLDFLSPANPGITKIHPDATSSADARWDVRLAVIRYIEKMQGKK